MSGRGPTTLHQVAIRAGVSIATVSRVARGVDQVSAETQRRVLDAIRELNYRPSQIGRALVNRRHNALGLIIPGLQGPYFSQLVHGFEQVVIDSQMAMFIIGTHQTRGNDDQLLSLADRVDGLAIMGGSINDLSLEKLSLTGKRMVLIAQHPMFDLPTIRVENYQATRQLVRHLIEVHGHRRLTFIGNVAGAPDPEERWLAFVTAHREAGLNPPPGPVEVGMEQTAGATAAHAIFAQPDPPTAIVCANDELAMGVMSVAESLGIDVPEQLAVTGFDDIPFARVTAPPLTTVRQPSRELGARAASFLLEDHPNDSASPRTDIVLSTELVIRASCGCGHHRALIDDLNASAGET
jgi:LacI family transcriptional regulator